ncbi:peptidylprolyl isomerase [uncultured Winogradskyella sp.]|uniref:peptidylprolyl isomerase n=1 Tax=uncultured Winogradskyella sp. TaxID=395353 RepID=UPI0026393444|nr:peptidylprolyl isomerase [uncultured Winogradskyella sp.]
MKIVFKLVVFLFLTSNVSFAQIKDQVLLKVDGEPVMTSEFIRVYNKNLDLVKDESQKDIDSYLTLFTEYQLKLKEAKRLKLDQDAKYQREFLRYKKQLTQNYLSENKVTEALVAEAYERSSYDINASHILVRLDATAKDTLSAYNRVLALKKRVENEGFDEVKQDAHNGKTVFLEDLGYFSAFKMVYDFESAAFNTPVNEFSKPFRTQFGYHVVFVKNKRKSRGTLTAAHIMISLQQKDSLLDPERRINDIYQKLQQGESFESLAKQFSDDKSSAKNGGQLAPFKSGQLSSVEFEDMAFSLKKDNAISKPFKTAYGWHIVKRIGLEPLKSFEEIKPTLESRVKRDSRSKLINNAMVEELKQRYSIVHTKEAKAYFESILNDDFFKRSWKFPDDFTKDKIIVAINNNNYRYSDFARHLLNAQRSYTNKQMSLASVVNREYNRFFEKVILRYREDNLELENKDFADILKEYRDGLLLFDLMEKEVWNKASKDSLGLEAYYNKNKSKYQWDDRVKVLIATTADKSIAKKLIRSLKNNRSEETMSAKFNNEETQNVIFTSGTYNLNDPKLPTNLELKAGVSKVYNHNDAFHVLDIKSIYPAGPKTLEEARGNVINDYQLVIETNWLKALQQRFNVEVNDKALKAVKKYIKKQH